MPKPAPGFHWGSLDAVFDLTSVAVVLTLCPNGVVTTLGRSAFVDDPDRLAASMVGCNDLLATITQTSVVSLDRIEEPLKRPRSDILIGSDRFGVLPLDVGE